MSCNDCQSQSCQKNTPATIVKWRFDYRKLFRLLALVSLVIAWFSGQELNRPDWKNALQSLYPQATIASIDNSDVLFTMTQKNSDYYVSIATENSFGGPLTVASIITSEGKVKSVDILNHSDTPAYIQKLKNAGYFRQFLRKEVDFLPVKDKNWDAVSGATLSSNAIMRANTRASHLIAERYFERTTEPLASTINYTVTHLLLALLIACSVANIWLKNQTLKLVYVLASTAVIGFMANQMISVSNFSAVMMGFIPSLSENLGLWILLGSTLLAIVLLGKNIYCGNICPFHGVQYLLHKISNLNLPLFPAVLKHAHYIPKVGLWAGLMVGFLTINPSAGSYEPFSMIFSLQGEGIQWFILPSILIGAFFIPDMFCRFFCPAGEMLTLLTLYRNKLVYLIKPIFVRNKGGSL